MQKTIKILLIPLIIGLFLSAILFTSAQIADTSAISLSGINWTLKVDSKLQTATDSKSTPYVSTTEKGEKELFLTLNSLQDCKLGFIQFKISTTGLTVYKQLPLNEEIQLKEGVYDFVNATHAMLKDTVKVYRPENVINSFACFDDSGKKVLHIYASKLIDADGNSVWVDSDLKDGLLTVYLDSKFLETAKFPILLDPTFGYTTVGATDCNQEGTIYGSKYTLTEEGTATKVSIYTGASATNDIIAAIYDTSYNKIWGTDSWASVVAGGWVNFTLSEAITAADYWILAYGAHPYYKYDSGTTNQSLYSYDTPWDDQLAIGGLEDRKCSMFVTYEPTATPTPTPTAEPTATPTPEPTTTPTEFTSTETWNIVILLVMLIVGLVLALKRTLPILNFVFGMFAIAISAWTLTVAPYFGGLLQLAVIIIGIIVMVSGYKEVY